jgi:hypothetical protein
MNPDRAEDPALTPEQIQEMTRFFQVQVFRQPFYSGCLDKYTR